MKRRLIPVLRDWPGYTGKFVREQADGAILNGTRIIKVGSLPGDNLEDGTAGLVHGSIDVVKAEPFLANKYRARYVYFVEWDGAPRQVYGVKDFNVGLPS